MLYRRMLLGRCGEMCYLNKLLMVSVLGWLFQVRHNLRILFIIVYSEKVEQKNLLSSLLCLPDSRFHFYFTDICN